MKNDKIYLQHILDAIISIEKFVAGVSKEEFVKSDLVQSAVIRKIEIIGEAVKNLSVDFKDKYNHIPWKHIAGMRDKLIHAYFGVDAEKVWEVTQKDMPGLKEEVNHIRDLKS